MVGTGAFVVVLTGPAWGDLHRLAPGQSAILGRDEAADIRIDDEGISRRHLQIEVGPDGVRVSDLGSQNGSFHQGERFESQLLTDGDRLQLGINTTLLFRTDEAQAMAEQARAIADLRDPATNLYRRPYFEDRVAAAPAPTSLLYLEIDQTPASPELLTLVAQIIEQGVRQGDLVARLDEHRFGILVPHDNATGVEMLAERLRNRVELARPKDGTRTTLSIGIAVGGQRPEAQISAAREALAHARKTGCNRAVTRSAQ